MKFRTSPSFHTISFTLVIPFEEKIHLLATKVIVRKINEIPIKSISVCFS